MKIDSYSNMIETNELLFQEVQYGAFVSPVELVRYNTLIKLMELQLKAIREQKILDTNSIDETKLSPFRITFTELTVDDEKKGTKTKQTTRTITAKKSRNSL